MSTGFIGVNYQLKGNICVCVCACVVHWHMCAHGAHVEIRENLGGLFSSFNPGS